MDVTFYLRSHVATVFPVAAAVSSSASLSATTTTTTSVDEVDDSLSLSQSREQREEERAAESNRFNLLRRRLSNRRSVLHVSSVSNWAPVCIGPYSQSNAINASMVVYVAGQIGLEAGTMSLQSPWPVPILKDEMQRQLLLSMQHCHRILACQQCLRWRRQENSSNIASVVLYLSRDAGAGIARMDMVVDDLCHTIRHCVRSYHGIGEDYTDAIRKTATASDDNDDDGPEESRRIQSAASASASASSMPLPITVVVVSSLPRGALVEVEVLAVNKGKMGFEQVTDSAAASASASATGNSSGGELTAVGQAVLDVQSIQPGTATTAITATTTGTGADKIDPLKPLFSLMGADALIASGDYSFAAPPPLSQQLPLIETQTQTQTELTTTALDVVTHHWKFQNCCAFGAIDCCVARPTAADTAAVADTDTDTAAEVLFVRYRRAFRAILDRVNNIVNGTSSSSNNNNNNSSNSIAPRLTHQALITIKIFYVPLQQRTATAQDLDLELLGHQVFLEVFPPVSGVFAPVVSFVPVCELYSAAQSLWRNQHILNNTDGSDSQSPSSSSCVCCCQFSAVDTVQLKTVNWIYTEQ